MFNGEIGLEIEKIKISKFADKDYEMTFYDKDKGFLHIVGQNDLKTLLEEALNNIDTTWESKKIY